jgi:hypothetical protein|tara:strand:+ start:1040 stop:1348 length:309 start_codon:yes stop_codon:yes gene_type:complete
MRLKQGVRVRGVRPELLIAMMVAEEVAREFDAKLILTSITEGSHSTTSLHYNGCAFDIRTWHLHEHDKGEFVKTMKERLGTNDFDVVLENDHIHVEFQPKGE